MGNHKIAQRASYLVIGANAVLLLIKAAASSVSDSLAIMSETVNSLTDVFASVAVLICVYIASQNADEKHPFGHSRAEPLAGLVVAIFTGIMGWEVIREPLPGLLNQVTEPKEVGPWALPALIITLVVKAGMTYALNKTARKVHSPALKASAIDCRNDMLVATVAIFGVCLAGNYPNLDTVAAIVIGVYILYNAYAIGRENVDYLMGTTPDAELMNDIRKAAEKVEHVNSVSDVRGHFVGTFVHVELAVIVDGDLTTADSHEIAETVRERLEAQPVIDRAFIHIEPEGSGRPAIPPPGVVK